jgi:hypothetical protein
MISIKRLKFNFINVPKNASTSIRRFFIDNVVQPEDMYSNYYESFEPFIAWNQNMPLKHVENSHMDVTYAIENGLLDQNETIVGVIRHPIERVLSLYLYRAKQGWVKTPSISDFRNSVRPYGYYPDRLSQNKLQSSFLEYKGQNIGTWWLFDNIETHINDFTKTYDIDVKHPLRVQNKSIKNRDTKEYVETFYDADTLAAVNKYYEKDIELYEGLKC